MRQGPHSKRGRGRGGNRRSGTPNRNHTFDSNGPDVRIRGNAHQVHEKYLNLARDASASGDRVLAESYFQHAEHYFRILSAFSEDANNEANRQRASGYNGNGSSQNYEAEPQPDVERSAQSPQQTGQTEGSSDAPQPPDTKAAQTGEVIGHDEKAPEKTAEAKDPTNDSGEEPPPLSPQDRGNGNGSSDDTDEQTAPSVTVTMVGAPAEEDKPAPARQRRRRQSPQPTTPVQDPSGKSEE